MYAIDARSDMQLYTSDGAGHLTGGQYVWPDGGLWRGFRDIAVADFSSDGWADVAGIDAYGDLRLYTGSPSGQLSGGALMWRGGGLWSSFRLLSAAPSPTGIRMYAIDGGNNMQLYVGDGAGRVTGGQLAWWPGGLWAGFKAITVGDYSGDGWPDVAGIDAYGDLRLYLGSPSGQLSGGALMWPGGGLWGGFRQIAADARTVVPCAGARTVYLPLGDSITEGDKSTSGNGYRAVLADKLSTVAPMGCGWSYAGTQASGSRYYPHEGYSGATINQIASHLPASLNAMAPAGLPVSVVLLGAGTNDDGQNRTADQMLSDMSALLDRIHTGRPGTKVLVAQITITRRNSPAQQQAERDFNAGLPALAAGKGDWVRVVDMSDVHLSADRIHPDDAGYADMAERWHAALTANGWLP